MLSEEGKEIDNFIIMRSWTCTITVPLLLCTGKIPKWLLSLFLGDLNFIHFTCQRAKNTTGNISTTVLANQD